MEGETDRGGSVNDDEDSSFRDFVAARGPALMRLGYLLTGGDQHAAEDLVQSALSKVVPRWGSIESPEAYVRQAMYRHQVSWWRRPSNREAAHAEVPDTPSPDGTGTVDLRLALRAALATLTLRQRAVLVLRYLEDMSEREVAETLGISVGTVRSTAHRSLALLRERTPALSDDHLTEEFSR
jgi:RNA polymerase sigma-70 factor (sigma-E family)